jgi:hypothetical protein
MTTQKCKRPQVDAEGKVPPKRQRRSKTHTESIEVGFGELVVLDVGTFSELQTSFEKVNVGKLITYTPHIGMKSMLNQPCKVVKIGGMMGEPDLIGLEPPREFKDKPGWQNGCWYFPRVICIPVTIMPTKPSRSAVPSRSVVPSRSAVVLRQQQQRLLLLRHAAACTVEHPKTCPHSKHCARMKSLWGHIRARTHRKGCDNNKCEEPHCVSSRYVLSHYHQCKDKECKVCKPVRYAIDHDNVAYALLQLNKAE